MLKRLCVPGHAECWEFQSFWAVMQYSNEVIQNYISPQLWFHSLRWRTVLADLQCNKRATFMSFTLCRALSASRISLMNFAGQLSTRYKQQHSWQLLVLTSSNSVLHVHLGCRSIVLERLQPIIVFQPESPNAMIPSPKLSFKSSLIFQLLWKASLWSTAVFLSAIGLLHLYERRSVFMLRPLAYYLDLSLPVLLFNCSITILLLFCKAIFQSKFPSGQYTLLPAVFLS